MTFYLFGRLSDQGCYACNDGLVVTIRERNQDQSFSTVIARSGDFALELPDIHKKEAVLVLEVWEGDIRLTAVDIDKMAWNNYSKDKPFTLEVQKMGALLPPKPVSGTKKSGRERKLSLFINQLSRLKYPPVEIQEHLKAINSYVPIAALVDKLEGSVLKINLGEPKDSLFFSLLDELIDANPYLAKASQNTIPVEKLPGYSWVGDSTEYKHGFVNRVTYFALQLALDFSFLGKPDKLPRFNKQIYSRTISMLLDAFEPFNASIELFRMPAASPVDEKALTAKLFSALPDPFDLRQPRLFDTVKWGRNGYEFDIPRLLDPRLQFDKIKWFWPGMIARQTCMINALSKAYTLTGLTNLDKTAADNQACQGDKMKLEGVKLRTQGRVVFANDVSAEILSWSPTTIEFRVPAQAVSGPLRLDLSYTCPGVGAFGIPTFAPLLEFVFIQPIQLISLQVGGNGTVRLLAPDQYEVEACHRAAINIHSQHVDRITLEDEQGILYDSFSSSITQTVFLIDRYQTGYHTYDIWLDNLCGRLNRRIQVSYFKQFTNLYGTSILYMRNTHTDPLGYDLLLSCLAPEGGLPVTIESSRPDTIASLQVLEAAGRPACFFTFTLLGNFNRVILTVQAPEYNSLTLEVIIYPYKPILHEVTPLTLNMCAPTQLTIRADGFNFDVRTNNQINNRIRLINDDFTKDFDLEFLQLLTPDDKLRNQVFIVEIKDMPPGSYNLHTLVIWPNSTRQFLPTDFEVIVPGAEPEFNSNAARQPSLGQNFVVPCIPTGNKVMLSYRQATHIKVTSNNPVRTLVDSAVAFSCQFRDAEFPIETSGLYEDLTVTLESPPNFRKSFPATLSLIPLAVPKASIVQILNNSNDTYYVWKLTLDKQSLLQNRFYYIDKKLLNSAPLVYGQTQDVELEPCSFVDIAIVSGNGLLAYNEYYPLLARSPSDEGVLEIAEILYTLIDRQTLGLNQLTINQNNHFTILGDRLAGPHTIRY